MDILKKYKPPFTKPRGFKSIRKRYQRLAYTGPTKEQLNIFEEAYRAEKKRIEEKEALKKLLENLQDLPKLSESKKVKLHGILKG